MRGMLRDAFDADAHHEQSQWDLIIGPTAWAIHFMLSYGTAAVYCAKAGGEMAPVRYAIAGYTVAALAVIGWAAWRGWLTWGGPGEKPPPLSRHTVEDRRRFIGLATLLLCVISAIGTVFDALPAVIFASCR